MESKQRHTGFDYFCMFLELIIGTVTLLAIVVELFTRYDTSRLFMPLLIVFYCIRAFNERQQTKRYIWDLFCAIGLFVLMLFIFRS